MSDAADPLGPSDVLILVNADSPVSRSVADMYRRYYPEITDPQVLYLSGLADCGSPTARPADEIITRQQFETLIAQPVRDYLVATETVDSVYCIITTAGMPYRIEDTDPCLADVVCAPGAPGCNWGSNPDLTVQNRDRVNAASVESELAALFQIDPGIEPDPDCPDASPMPIDGRVVNPYQAYCSGIKSWAAGRDILSRRATFSWTHMWLVNRSPKIEGTFWGGGTCALNRTMCPGDLYLVARLDGPRARREYPIFAVKDMLDRSAAVSNPGAPAFVGYNSDMCAAVIDDSADTPPDTYSYSQVYNYPPIDHPSYTLDFDSFPTPPGAELITGSGFNEGNHYDLACIWLTGQTPTPGLLAYFTMPVGLGGTLVWDDTSQIMNQAFLDPTAQLVGLVTYGRNAGDGRPRDYLLTAGPDGGPLFRCAPGAIFSSLESFNAVTMFTDTPTTIHGKIAEFIAMGGSAAVGHAFEPERGALIQADFLLRNWLRDDDGDGVGDLALAEAVFTAMPYLSWSEVLIGDPLMRLRVGPGGCVHPEGCPWDVNGNSVVSMSDIVCILRAYNSHVGEPRYNPAADLNRNGVVSMSDIVEVLRHYNTVCYE